MCGISGIINLGGVLPDDRILLEMNDALSHRGPDGEGFFTSKPGDLYHSLKTERPNCHTLTIEDKQFVALGHRRLSILDLSESAAQPMLDSSKNYVIVFNGEIYNHSELRKELQSIGYDFHTDHSDTEVILNAYACWGVKCLERFNGMWAFCIWDLQKNQIFMSRDRTGKKPLYYSIHNQNLFFASELKAILRNKHISREIDPTAVYDFLTYQMVPAPRTIFKGIEKLPAGHYMFFRPGEEIVPKRFWSALSDGDYFDKSEQEIVKELRDHLYEAGRLRMLADVEVGVLLSGGIDSSVNLACLSKFATRPIKAFSVGFENRNGYKNEFPFARKVAKHFGADYRELTLTQKDFFDFFPKMVYYQDEPIADPANIPIYYISKTAAAEGVKVLLGGEGSDELFVGYEHWNISRNFGNLVEGRPNLAKMLALIHASGPLRNKRKYYHGWYEKVIQGTPNFWSGSEIRSEKLKRQILSKEFLSKLGDYSSFEPIREIYEVYNRLAQKKDPFNWMTVSDLQYRLPDLLLARLDRMMMAASVEGRNPFLDVNVVNFALRIPPEFRYRNGESKYILKKAFEGILPHEILYRKKDSFSVPLGQLFSDKENHSMCMQAIHEMNATCSIFTDEYISRLEIKAESLEFWNISNLALWHQRYSKM